MPQAEGGTPRATVTPYPLDQFRLFFNNCMYSSVSHVNRSVRGLSPFSSLALSSTNGCELVSGEWQ